MTKSPGAEIQAVQTADVPDQEAGPSPEIRLPAQPGASGLRGLLNVLLYPQFTTNQFLPLYKNAR